MRGVEIRFTPKEARKAMFEKLIVANMIWNVAGQGFMAWLLGYLTPDFSSGLIMGTLAMGFSVASDLFVGSTATDPEPKK
jgi:hypothetical protein